MSVMNIILVCIVLIVFLNTLYVSYVVYRNSYSRESFDMLEITPDSIIRQEENRQCPLVLDSQSIQSMVNYELLEHPTDPNACHIRYENQEISRASCSKTNTDIYTDALGNTVSFKIDSIYDPYKSTLLEKDVCVVGFSGDDLATKQVSASTYAKFLTDNDFRVRNTVREIQTTTKSIEQKQTNIDLTKTATKTIYDTDVPSLNLNIKNIQGEIKTTNDGVGSKNTDLQKLKNELALLQKNPHILRQGFYITNRNVLVNPSSGDKLEMLDDGRLRLSDKDNKTRWESRNTVRGLGPHRLTLTDKGHLFIVNKHNTIVWIPGRVFRHTDKAPYTLIVQGDGNLVLYDGNKKALWTAKTQPAKQAKKPVVKRTIKPIIKPLLQKIIQHVKKPAKKNPKKK